MKSYDYQMRQGRRDISWEQFHSMCRELAERLAAERPEIILGVARGGLYPATLIAGMLRREFYPIRITRRENDQVKWDHPIWKVDIPATIMSARVAVVDDIVDTGETLALVSQRAAERGAASVTTVTLVAHSWANPKPDFCALETDELIIFPWDIEILADGRWGLHPELQAALRRQAGN